MLMDGLGQPWIAIREEASEFVNPIRSGLSNSAADLPVVDKDGYFSGKPHPFLDSCELIALEPFGVTVVLSCFGFSLSTPYIWNFAKHELPIPPPF